MDIHSRVLIFDLLVERSEFGHGGNQEIIKPFAEFGDVKVLLVTPQMQSSEIGKDAQILGEVYLEKNDVPLWDEDFQFWNSCEIEINKNNVKFMRIAMPSHSNDELMSEWLNKMDVNAVICSGSRRNVTMWESWMEYSSSLLRASINLEIPTLGICFGHQLLCHSLGSKISRFTELSNGVWDLSLTKKGEMDELFSLRGRRENESPVVLFTHREHVMSIPENCTLLGYTDHNEITAIRVNNQQGVPLPVWGVQFHPEAAKARVERAFEWGHISKEELDSFQRDHDGAGILESFADIALGN